MVCCALCGCCLQAIQYVAVLAVIYWVVRAGMEMAQSFSPKKPSRFGNWAVVTGCTSGIGEAFAKELAKQKMNIILVGRSMEGLKRVAGEIEAASNVQTRSVQIDLGTATSADFDRAIAQIKETKEIGILINNAGLSYDHPEYFDQADVEQHRNIVQVNIRALTEMTYGILPVMVANKKGAIVNISSLSGSVPAPFLATYAASKTYVDSFSEALAGEYKKKGVVVQSCVPGFVVSKLSKIRKPSLTTPTPEVFARAAIGAIGNAPAFNYPYIPHRIQFWVMNALPRPVTEMIVSNMHLGIRSRALKKKSN